MVKGVNKNIIEVHDTGSVFFDRAILFVKPEYALFDGEKLFRDAKRYVNNADLNRRFGKSRNRRINEKAKILGMTACSVASVVLTAVICYFAF